MICFILYGFTTEKLSAYIFLTLALLNATNRMYTPLALKQATVVILITSLLPFSLNVFGGLFFKGISIIGLHCLWFVSESEPCNPFNSLKTKRRLLYLKAQSVPRSKHFSSRL